ncbi:MAG: DUF5678 domain-containing protein [Phycisphaerales bacterium]|nr:DUF5678 domain-containing protein [Phycisphaerales bacterium]
MQAVSHTNGKIRRGGAKARIRQTSRHVNDDTEYYRRIRARLYRDPSYRGKYIAIRDRRIVGVHADKFVLYKQITETFPDHRFLVMPVWSEFPTVDV